MPPPQSGAAQASGRAAPPKTKREAIVETLHGVEVADPYRWLEDPKTPGVKAWMDARNAHARGYLSQLPHREALVQRLKALLYVDAVSVPTKRANRYFFSRKRADQEKSVHYWKEGADGEEKVLIDPVALGEDRSVGVVVPSYDGKRVAYMLKTNNADESTLHVMEVDTGAVSKVDVIGGLRYTSASWSPDNAGFYYTWLPDPNQAEPKIAPADLIGYGELRYHRLGTDPKTDKVLKGKTGDPRRWLSGWVSEDGKFLFASISFGWSEQDVFLMRLDAPNPKWAPLAVGTKALYKVQSFGGALYVATNKDAPKWAVFKVDPNKLERKDWALIIPEDKQAVLTSLDVIGKRLSLSYLKNASSALRIHDLNGKRVREVKLPTLGTASPLYGSAEDDEAFFSFSSFTYPKEIYRTSIASGEVKRFAKVEVPVKPEDFEVNQVWYASKDGTQVSMFLVHKKGLKKDGKNPTLLYGYGGFNISLTPRFTAYVYPWLERGGVYAVPNLRGGGEYGELWHQGGMKSRKQNVFDDFLGAAQWLVDNGYTEAAKLGIRGGSNGGLLVGAAMTQRPQMFGAVICGVPLLDMVRYHKFGVGKAWIPEYGSPEVAEEFKVLHAYSPYHRVKKDTPYPALLMLSADSDDRVDPMHARKFTAAIEFASSSGAPNLLRIESKAGHGGADLRKAYLQKSADQLAFLWSQLAN